MEGRCTIIGGSESATARPERISFVVNNGSTYKVFALNWGPGADTVTITVTLR